MFNGLYSFLKFVAVVFGSFFALIILITTIFVLVGLIKGNKIPKRKVKSDYKKLNIFVKLFYDLPKAISRDFFQRNPDALPYHGLYMICGPQGSGKTITAIYLMRMWQMMYPLIKIRSNISISFQDGQITHWKQLINVHNGEIGQIDFLDETQNWFNSNESKNFPVDMLQEITQERKKHKVIIGTSQVFTRLAKPLREQTTYLCEPHTFLGCFTFVFVYKPILKDDGILLKKKFYKIFCFVHDDDLRASYNTYERVERLASKGFQESACDTSNDVFRLSPYLILARNCRNFI